MKYEDKFDIKFCIIYTETKREREKLNTGNTEREKQ